MPPRAHQILTIILSLSISAALGCDDGGPDDAQGDDGPECSAEACLPICYDEQSDMLAEYQIFEAGCFDAETCTCTPVCGDSQCEAYCQQTQGATGVCDPIASWACNCEEPDAG